MKIYHVRKWLQWCLIQIVDQSECHTKIYVNEIKTVVLYFQEEDEGETYDDMEVAAEEVRYLRYVVVFIEFCVTEV